MDLHYQIGREYEVMRIPFFGSPQSRDGQSTSLDTRFVNGYFEPVKNQLTNEVHYCFTKRPGTLLHSQPPATTATGRGCISWDGVLFSVYDVGSTTHIYAGTSSITSFTSQGIQPVSFAITRPGATTQYLGINDGVNLYLIASDHSTVTTGFANFPSPNTGDLIYMDGYWFVMKTNGQIFNCAVDDPTSWSVSNVINAQMLASTGVGLTKQNNLLMALTDRSIQFFYNAANSAGSPLTNVEQAMHKIGCVNRGSIAIEEDTTFWVGNGLTGGPTVWMLHGISDLKEIGSPSINRYLNVLNTGALQAYMIGQTCRTGGRTLYILSIAGPTGVSGSAIAGIAIAGYAIAGTSSVLFDRTFVYDTDLNEWYEWVSGGESSTTAFNISYLTQHQNKLIAQDATDGNLYWLDAATYRDNGSNFTVTARTHRLDFGSMNRKFIKRLEVIGDQQLTTANASLTYSDDDYVTNSSARTVDLSKTRTPMFGWGNFRRRSFQLTYAGNTPFRVYGFEMDIGQATE